jgi:hypothetical protein
MPVMKLVPISSKVKVAAVFELDQITPAWFQVAGQKPVRIEQVSSIWYQNRGSGKLINFDVGAAGENFCLTFDTVSLDWSLGKTVIE